MGGGTTELGRQEGGSLSTGWRSLLGLTLFLRAVSASTAWSTPVPLQICRYPRYHSNLSPGPGCLGPSHACAAVFPGPTVVPAEGERSPWARSHFPAPPPLKAEPRMALPAASLAQTFPSPQMTSHSPGYLDSAPGARELHWHLPCTPWFWILREEIPIPTLARPELGFQVLEGQRSLTALPPLLWQFCTPAAAAWKMPPPRAWRPTSPPEPEPEPGISIVILLVYRTLGGLLPAQFQAERGVPGMSRVTPRPLTPWAARTPCPPA